MNQCIPGHRNPNNTIFKLTGETSFLSLLQKLENLVCERRETTSLEHHRDFSNFPNNAVCIISLNTINHPVWEPDTGFWIVMMLMPYIPVLCIFLYFSELRYSPKASPVVCTSWKLFYDMYVVTQKQLIFLNAY